MKNFFLGEHPIGDGAVPLFFPDIGTFFNQDMHVAESLIRQLHSAGATLIKGEVLHDANIALNDGTMENYLGKNGCFIQERNRSLIERKVVSLSSYENLFNLCKSLDMGFLLSVYDFKGAEFAREIGACGLKIASSNIVHRPLIEYVAKLGLPLIIDTGRSSLEEIARAIRWASDAGSTEILIQHSPEAPPSPLTNHNLRMLTTLANVFNRPVGLSDHHAGEEMLYAAVALGAQALEKGIVPDDNMDDQDVYHALKVSMFNEVYAKCRRIHEAMGSAMRYLDPNAKKHPYRMGLVAAKDLYEGDILSLDTVSFAFPSKGIPVEHWEAVERSYLRRDMARGEIIGWQDVRFDPS